jgi:hypothetical protein
MGEQHAGLNAKPLQRVEVNVLHLESDLFIEGFFHPPDYDVLGVETRPVGRSDSKSIIGLVSSNDRDSCDRTRGNICYIPVNRRRGQRCY